MASDARHWLHESYGSGEYESSRASRVAEARRLILGGDERIGGVAEAGLYASWLKAAILFARGDPKAAASELIKAAEREEGLMYDEPVTFFAPLRHEAGSMLLAAGDGPATCLGQSLDGPRRFVVEQPLVHLA